MEQRNASLASNASERDYRTAYSVILAFVADARRFPPTCSSTRERDQRWQAFQAGFRDG